MLDYVEVLLEPPASCCRPARTTGRASPSSAGTCSCEANLVPDAYLAALALEQGAELITFDRGFGRYPRLRWRCLLDG